MARSAEPLNLLVVEDELPLARLWAAECSDLAEFCYASSLAEGRARLRDGAFDALLLDLNLPDGNGLDLLREITGRHGGMRCIVLTANTDVASVVQALRLRAYDYLIKPFKIVELEERLQRMADERQVHSQTPLIPPGARKGAALPRLMGAGPALDEVWRLATRVAPTSATVLLQGETGTGKEVMARLLHDRSPRCDLPFVPINCAALPQGLAESELFGHRKGAFTGADREHRGLVQAAAGGTLFLDEIGDLPLDMQAKFLRLLESGEGRRVGDTDSYRVDIRVIAATNRNLQQEVALGHFREDLFYRLATIELRLPSLREMIDDLPSIAVYLLETVTIPGSLACRFSAAALQAMCQYRWPGNVRQLRNMVERAKIFCDGEEIEPEHLALPVDDPPMLLDEPPMTLLDMERRMIRQALVSHGGNKTLAARSLGISLRTLYNKLDGR